MSDTPTAALAAAEHSVCIATWKDRPQFLITQHSVDAHLVDGGRLVANLTEQGWSLVPSGSLLDMARAVVALADVLNRHIRVDVDASLSDRVEDAKAVQWVLGFCACSHEASDHEDGLGCMAAYDAFPDESVFCACPGYAAVPHVATIAAAREMVAAEPGT